MSELAIEVKDLSKQYRLGLTGTGTISHDLNRWWHRMRGKPDPYLKIGEENNRAEKGMSQYVWALKDINFKVNKGTSLGIIGKNGAGKSTLLKILSRVTGPTTGAFKIKGRIASLLEVGTGFHPELTGRENVFMNGALLGMTKAEIRKKFDEIVSFSGIERYIDTPAKRYSSGMYVRLAFAVAAHLDSEILIADEVLAVGDSDFQKKCLGKMKDVTGQGRTVLFVSHNLVAVKQLCTEGIYLKNGMISFAGKTQETINAYYESSETLATTGIVPDDFERFNTGEIKIREISILNKGGDITDEVFFKEVINVRIRMFVFKPVEDAIIDVQILSKDRIVITHTLSTFEGIKPYSLNEGLHEFNITLENPMQPGFYSLTIGVHYSSGKTIDFLENIYNFTVLKLGDEQTEHYQYNWVHGYVRLNSKWIKA